MERPDARWYAAYGKLTDTKDAWEEAVGQPFAEAWCTNLRDDQEPDPARSVQSAWLDFLETQDLTAAQADFAAFEAGYTAVFVDGVTREPTDMQETAIHRAQIVAIIDHVHKRPLPGCVFLRSPSTCVECGKALKVGDQGRPVRRKMRLRYVCPNH